jgi:outer membrane protein OmpA-like peptidoglycan-associated protein
MKHIRFGLLSKSNLAIWAMLTAILILAAPTAQAQKKKGKGGSKADQAAALVKDANQLFEVRQYATALNMYKQAAKLQPTNYYAQLGAGRCSNQLNKLDDAVKYFTAATEVAPDKDSSWFFLGTVLKKQENYQESTRSFEKFLENHKKDDALQKIAKLEIQGNAFGEKQAKVPQQYDVTPVPFNAKGSDFDPSIFKVGNNKYMLFSSHRVGNMGKLPFAEFGEEFMSDIWQAQMTSDSTFKRPENMGKMINTLANDGASCISPDGLTMYYSICGQGKIGKIWGCSIYQSKFDPEKKRWGKFTLVQGINGQQDMQINSKGKIAKVPTYDTHPYLSPDGATMFFVSDRKGGIGGNDIYYSKKAGNTWTPPVNLGRTINTEFNEIQPYVSDDGKTLYFASEGRGGLGGYDLYKADGQETTWSEPMNLGRDLNSSYDDTGILWLEKDSLGFVTSNRPGGKGKDDIFLARRIPNTTPEAIEISVQGRVRDLKTKQAIPFATVTLYLTAGNTITPLDTFKTDQSGSYKFVLERGNDYKLVGNAPEYLANEEMVSTKDLKKSAALEKDIDIYLERIEVNKPIVLQNIYYDFDKAVLRAEAIVELDRLIRIMTENPGMTIQVGSHTDTNGSERYNIGLSNRRAKSVVDYLAKNGIAKNRINFLGFGESQPLIYPELSDADEQANRRSEFRIRTMDLPVAAKPAKPAAKKTR